MLKIHLWKIALLIGLLLSVVAFILGWIGFGVPDWHEFHRFNNSIIEYYGLWAYCQQQTAGVTTICKRWPTAANQLFDGNRPNFIDTSDGLITTGMILLSIGLVIALLALALPYLAYGAALFAFLAFVFLVVGLPIFGRQSNAFSAARGDFEYHKRYGFWLFVPTIVLEFLSILFYLLAGILYRLFGFGNVASSCGGKYASCGGQQALGAPIRLNTYGSMNRPMAYRFQPPMVLPPQFARGAPMGMLPSLLSEYVTVRRPQAVCPPTPPIGRVSVFPKPSAAQTYLCETISTVAPAYTRREVLSRPSFDSIINLTNETVTGPLRRLY